MKANNKITESSEEITIPGLTSYKNIADTFDNYKAFAANFEPVIIVKINRQYYVYKTTAESSQDYSYQTDNENNIEGWLYGMVQANNHRFKTLGEEFMKSKKTESNSLDGKDVTNDFQLINAFANNFEPIRVIKNSYDKNYYIYKADETDSKNYLDFSRSKDYIDGWLSGAIKANNKVIQNKTESLMKSKKTEVSKNVQTVNTKIGNHDVEIEVDYTDRVPKIDNIWWNYDNNMSSTGFKYDEEEDKFFAFAYDNFLTAKQEQTLKNKIKQIIKKGTKTENKMVEAIKTRIPTNELPDFCYAYNDSTGEIIVIKKGVEGYYPSKIKLDDTLTGKERKQRAEEIVKEQNEMLDVTEDQALQMQLNSMFGWDDTKTETKKLKKEDISQEDQELIDNYKNRISGMVTDTTTNAFTQLKEILEDENKDTEVEGFYFPEKAVQIINNSKTQYHLNGYMDLTVADILNYVEDFDSVTDVIDDIFSEYKPDSALSWADNFVTILNKLDFDIDDYFDEDYYEESKKLNEDNTTDLESLKNILEDDGWGPIDESEQNGETVWEIRQFTPAGEDWSFVIFFDGTVKDAINEIVSYANDFDANEEQSTYIDMRGQRGIPDDVQTLLDDGKWKKETLMELANELQQLDLDESKKITESNDNTNILWENIEDYSEEEKENIRDIIDKLNVKAVESKEHSVKIRDENSKLEFWIDYAFDGFDIIGEWNQYIFNTDNETDRIKQAIQTSYDADTESLIAFDQMESEGFAYLEKKGIVKDTNDGYRFTD